jgi:hypothetical protein
MADQEDYNYNCNLQQFQRNRYFYGKLMSVRDFETEQDYMNEKRHLLNRLVHGAGIVCGLDGIQVVTQADGKITLSFEAGGVALDNCGREIVVPAGSSKEIFIQEAGQVQTHLTTVTTGLFYLSLHYEPRDYEFVNSADSPSSCEETCCPSRIIEDFQVIATDTPPPFPSLICPDLSAIQAGDANAGQQARELIENWAKERAAGCDEDGVFILALTVSSSSATADNINTLEYLSVVYNNKLLSQLLSCHISDFNNPHKTTAAQLGALKSIDDVQRDDDGNVDLVENNAITITPDEETHTVTIGETHSSITTGNPHSVTAAEAGALVSISGVSNPGGNVDLITDMLDAITIITDEAQHTITISETHSPRTDNPHSITIEQIIGAFPNTGGTIDGSVSITTGGAVSISGSLLSFSGNPVSFSGRQVSITGERMLSFSSGLVSITSGRLLSLTSGTLFSRATDSYGVRGLLTASEPGPLPTPGSAAVEAITTASQTYGLYAAAPLDSEAIHAHGPAGFDAYTYFKGETDFRAPANFNNDVYFGGYAYINGGKSGYVVDTFKNASGITLRTGDIVKLEGSAIVRFHGSDNKLPVAEVTLADTENDTRTIGIVDRKAVPPDTPPGSSSQPDASTRTPGDLSAIEDGEELLVVTLGAYSRCKVDASTVPVQAGDLLTSSTNPGYAQKAVNPQIGTIIGKALEPMEQGTGHIAVFVNIQ